MTKQKAIIKASPEQLESIGISGDLSGEEVVVISYEDGLLDEDDIFIMVRPVQLDMILPGGHHLDYIITKKYLQFINQNHSA